MAPSSTVLITGGNTGLGFETARIIARNPEIMTLIACRNAELGEQAARGSEPRAETPWL